jgi:hypothetical protein
MQVEPDGRIVEPEGGRHLRYGAGSAAAYLATDWK